MSLKYEPAPEPLHISASTLLLKLQDVTLIAFSIQFEKLGNQRFFSFTLVTGPRRSLSLTLSDTRVYEP